MTDITVVVASVAADVPPTTTGSSSDDPSPVIDKHLTNDNKHVHNEQDASQDDGKSDETSESLIEAEPSDSDEKEHDRAQPSGVSVADIQTVLTVKTDNNNKKHDIKEEVPDEMDECQREYDSINQELQQSREKFHIDHGRVMQTADIHADLSMKAKFDRLRELASILGAPNIQDLSGDITVLPLSQDNQSEEESDTKKRINLDPPEECTNEKSVTVATQAENMQIVTVSAVDEKSMEERSVDRIPSSQPCDNNSKSASEDTVNPEKTESEPSPMDVSMQVDKEKKETPKATDDPGPLTDESQPPALEDFKIAKKTPEKAPIHQPIDPDPGLDKSNVVVSPNKVSSDEQKSLDDSCDNKKNDSQMEHAQSDDNNNNNDDTTVSDADVTMVEATTNKDDIKTTTENISESKPDDALPPPPDLVPMLEPIDDFPTPNRKQIKQSPKSKQPALPQPNQKPVVHSPSKRIIKRSLSDLSKAVRKLDIVKPVVFESDALVQSNDNRNSNDIHNNSLISTQCVQSSSQCESTSLRKRNKSEMDQTDSNDNNNNSSMNPARQMSDLKKDCSYVSSSSSSSLNNNNRTKRQRTNRVVDQNSMRVVSSVVRRSTRTRRKPPALVFDTQPRRRSIVQIKRSLLKDGMAIHCGRAMNRTEAHETYEGCSVVICDKCEKECSGRAKVFSCSAGKCSAHPDGLDYCLDCAAELFVSHI